MKILVVTHYFGPHRGGIENVASNQAAVLAALGHEVTIVTSAIPIRDFVPAPQYRIIRVRALNILEEKLGVPYPIFSPLLFNVIRREVRAADVVHGHGHVYMTSVLAALLAHRYGKPFILTQHNTFVRYRSRVLRLMQRFADAFLGKYTIKRASKVVAVSKATQDYITSVRSTDAVVHYNGVDLERFRPNSDTEIRRRLSIPVDKTVCLCVRRITFKNGIGTLLDVAEMLRDAEDIVFVVCGTGADLDAARSRMSASGLTNVIFSGPVADADLPSYYSASDVFILPSTSGEGFPLVVLEALASGLPIVATRSGGHVEVLEAQGCGHLVEPDSPLEIAELLRSLVGGSELLGRAAGRSRQVAEASFSWSKNVQDLLGVFSEVQA